MDRRASVKLSVKVWEVSMEAYCAQVCHHARCEQDTVTGGSGGVIDEAPAAFKVAPISYLGEGKKGEILDNSGAVCARKTV